MFLKIPTMIALLIAKFLVRLKSNATRSKGEQEGGVPKEWHYSKVQRKRSKPAEELGKDNTTWIEVMEPRGIDKT